MTKAQSPDNHSFTDFPLSDHYDDDAVVERALPVSTRPPGAKHRSPGAPYMAQPQRNLRPPTSIVGGGEDATGGMGADEWGREVTEWANTTFPKKIDGVVGGQVRSRAASDGSIIFATGLDHYPTSVMIQPREPVNFIRAYVVPEEERHLVDAAKGLVLAPGDVAVKCMIFDEARGGGGSGNFIEKLRVWYGDPPSFDVSAYDIPLDLYDSYYLPENQGVFEAEFDTGDNYFPNPWNIPHTEDYRSWSLPWPYFLDGRDGASACLMSIFWNYRPWRGDNVRVFDRPYIAMRFEFSSRAKDDLGRWADMAEDIHMEITFGPAVTAVTPNEWHMDPILEPGPGWEGREHGDDIVRVDSLIGGPYIPGSFNYIDAIYEEINAAEGVGLMARVSPVENISLPTLRFDWNVPAGVPTFPVAVWGVKEYGYVWREGGDIAVHVDPKHIPKQVMEWSTF